MTQRIQKLNKLIRQHLDGILTRELMLKPGVFLTISKVDTTADLRYTRVSVSVFPFKESDYALKTIEKEIYKIQGELNKKLKMRPLPRLQFNADATEEEADKIEKILADL